MNKVENSGETADIQQIIQELKQNQLEEEPLPNQIIDFEIRHTEFESTSQKQKLEDQFNMYLELIEKRPSLEQAIECVQQLENNEMSNIVGAQEDIEVLNEQIKQMNEWISQYNTLKQTNGKFQQYEELLNSFQKIKLRTDFVIEIINKLIQFIIWQNDFKILLNKLKVNTNLQGKSDKVFVEQNDIIEMINSYNNIGIQLENTQMIQETYQYVQQSNDLLLKISKAIQDPNTDISHYNQLQEEYLAQNILIKDFQALKFKVLHQNETEAIAQGESTLEQIEEKLQLLQSIEQCAGKEIRSQLQTTLKSKQETGQKLSKKIQDCLSTFNQVTKENLKQLNHLYQECIIKKVKPLNFNECANIIRMCKWLINIRQCDSGKKTQKKQNETSAISEKQIKNIEEFSDQILFKIQNMSLEQLNTLKNEGEKCHFIDQRILDIYNKVIEVYYIKSCKELLNKKDIDYQQLESLLGNVSHQQQISNLECFGKIQEIYEKAQNFQKKVKKLQENENFQKINKILQEKKEYGDICIYTYIDELEQIINAYTQELDIIKGFKKEVETLKRLQIQIYSTYILEQVKKGSDKVNKETLKEKILLLQSSPKTPELFELQVKLEQALLNIDEYKADNEIKRFLEENDIDNNKKKTLKDVKEIFEKVNKKEQFVLEDVEQKVNILKEQISTCENWLERVYILTQNTKLQKEYLEDEQNVEFISGTIQTLKEQQKGLPYDVIEGSQVLDSYQWSLNANLMLYSKKGQYTLQEWQEFARSSDNLEISKELLNMVQEEIEKAEIYQEAIKKIRSDDEQQTKNSTSCIYIEDLKKLAQDIFSSPIKLENEIKYIKDLLFRIQQHLEQLDELLLQTSNKCELNDISKMLEKLKELPVQVKDYQKAVENKIQKVINLTKKFRKIQEINTNTAEQLLTEYNECNVFISDGNRLQLIYNESLDIINSINSQLHQYSEYTPITYEDILKLCDELEKVHFDAKGKLSEVLEQIFILKFKCLREANKQILEELVQTEQLPRELLEQVEFSVYKGISVQIPEDKIILPFNVFKCMICQGYALRKRFKENQLLKSIMDIMEWIANKIEDFILDIYKIKDIEKLDGVQVITLQFIDCGILIENHKKCLRENQWGYQPVLESLVVKEDEEQQQLVDVVGAYVFNQKLAISPVQEDIGGEFGKKEKNYEPSSIVPLEEEKKTKKKNNKQKIPKQLLEKRVFLLEEEENKDQLNKKMKFDENKLIKKQTIGDLIKIKKSKNSKEKEKKSVLKKIELDEIDQNLKKKTIKKQEKFEIENNQSNKSESEITKRKKFWQETAEEKKKNEIINQTARSGNIAKIRTYLERCNKYLKLTSLDALNIAKRLEGSCFNENQKNKKNYEKFIEGIQTALKKIRKMKYLMINFMEQNYKLSFLLDFVDLDMDTITQENLQTKEKMLEKRQKMQIYDKNINLLEKRKKTENFQENLEKIKKKQKIPDINNINNSSNITKIKKNKSPSKSSFKSTSIPKSSIQNNEEDIDKVKKIRKKSKFEELTRANDKKKKSKKHSKSELEELLLTQNLEPLNTKKQRYKKEKEQKIEKYQNQYNEENEQILKFYEGKMKFSRTKSAKVLFLTGCNYYTVAKLPYIEKTDETNLAPESSISHQRFMQQFSDIMLSKKNKGREIMVGGWIKTVNEQYQQLCQKTAEEFLDQQIVGLMYYTDDSVIYFLHKDQLKLEWQKYLVLRSMQQSHYYCYCFVIVSKDIITHDTYKKVQPCVYDPKEYKNKKKNEEKTKSQNKQKFQEHFENNEKNSKIKKNENETEKKKKFNTYNSNNTNKKQKENLHEGDFTTTPKTYNKQEQMKQQYTSQEPDYYYQKNNNMLQQQQQQGTRNYQEFGVNPIQDMKNAYRKKASVGRVDSTQDQMNYQQNKKQQQQYKSIYDFEDEELIEKQQPLQFIDRRRNNEQYFSKQPIIPPATKKPYVSFEEQQEKKYFYPSKNEEFNKFKAIESPSNNYQKSHNIYQNKEEVYFKDKQTQQQQQQQDIINLKNPKLNDREHHITILNINQTNNMGEERKKQQQQLLNSRVQQDKKQEFSSIIGQPTFEQRIKDKFTPLQKQSLSQSHFEPQKINEQITRGRVYHEPEYDEYKQQQYNRDFQYSKKPSILQQDYPYPSTQQQQQQSGQFRPESQRHYQEFQQYPPPPHLEQFSRNNTRSPYPRMLTRNYEHGISGDIPQHYQRDLYSKPRVTHELEYTYDNPEYSYTSQQQQSRLSYNQDFARRTIPFQRNNQTNTMPYRDYEFTDFRRR